MEEQQVLASGRSLPLARREQLPASRTQVSAVMVGFLLGMMCINVVLHT